MKSDSSTNWQCLTRIEAAPLLKSRAERHYVYVLFRGRGLPFYVGKGTIGMGIPRIFQHEAEARTEAKSYKLNILRVLARRQVPVLYAFDSHFQDEKLALARERYLIQAIGRHDLKTGPLANLTDGGEGPSNPSEESREAHRQTLYGVESGSSERIIANRFYQKLTDVKSVPIKPADGFAAKALSSYPIPIGVTPRSAAALAASAIANRVLLKDGCRIPRRLILEGMEMVIENGAGGAILKSGLAELAPDSVAGREIFVLRAASVEYITSQIDRSLLEDAGVLEPIL
jgi:hypothetical protein